MITWEHPDIQDKELFRQLYKMQAQEQGVLRRLFGKRELDPAWLEGLTELSLTGLQIKSFAFLRLCPNLKELELGRRSDSGTGYRFLRLACGSDHCRGNPVRSVLLVCFSQRDHAEFV